MNWEIKFGELATKQMEKMDKGIAKKITRYLDEKIRTLDNPRMLGKPLGGDKSGMWRYRVENYRIICEIQDDTLIVLVLRLGNRRNVYD